MTGRKRRAAAPDVSPDATVWCGETVAPGERKTVQLTVSQTYSGAEIHIPVVVWRGLRPGPTLAVVGAIHGDEINGTGAIRRLIMTPPFELLAGTLVLIPVVNIFGFERFTRYLPDRRDLNRCFPGSTRGSLASRLAHIFFDSIIRRCDFAIDLHSAAVRRTNFPNIRANMTIPGLAEFARAFGAELIISSHGPKGSMRAASETVGCRMMILEAGEVWKVEPAVLEYAIRGITNCLLHLAMIKGRRIEPAYRIETDATQWLRANRGGFLVFHVGPGDIVRRGQAIATNTDLVGVRLNIIKAPREGIVVGLSTLPSVAPGDPICHIAYARSGELQRIQRKVDGLADDALHERTRDDLATSVDVTAVMPAD